MKGGSKVPVGIFCDAGAHPPSLRLLRLLRAGQDGPELGRGHHGEGGHDHVDHGEVLTSCYFQVLHEIEKVLEATAPKTNAPLLPLYYPN